VQSRLVEAAFLRRLAGACSLENAMKLAVTGIKPTGAPHLGNYFGMIQPALGLAREYQALYFIADYHALTSVKNAERVRQLTYEAAATWLALGLDPQRMALYRQSDVPEVCELTWILFCVTPKGLLNRAHAYKAAVEENLERGRDPDASINMGLFNYPILMAADILFPGADGVPVGLDQKQHVEIAQDVAQAFNAVYGPVLKVPEAIIDERVMTIPGLDGRKMSKSYGNVIPIFAPPEELRKLVMRIKTDSRPPEEPKDAESSLIFQLYRYVAPEPTVERMRERFERGGLGYGEAKGELFEVLEERFREPRAWYEEILADRAEIERVLAAGADKAREKGVRVLARVREAVGANP
jgi:tryptophanyl-tRNA synthetase